MACLRSACIHPAYTRAMAAKQERHPARNFQQTYRKCLPSCHINLHHNACCLIPGELCLKRLFLISSVPLPSELVVAIAEVLNDMKNSTWRRAMQIAPHVRDGISQLQVMPSQLLLSGKWVRNLYVSDAQARSKEVTQELEAQVGDDILMLDWTKDAASRSHAN